MANHSLEAQKALQASEMKRRSFWPGLAREGGKLILTHPHRGGYKHKADLAAYVAGELPEFRWDSKRGRWEAPLGEALLKKVCDAFTQAGEVQLRLAKSLTADDTVTLIVQYEAGQRIIRSAGEIVGVQRNGDEPRRPRGSTSPDDAHRTLASRGYQFAGNEWLDKSGTTFRPRQKQMFSRPAILTM